MKRTLTTLFLTVVFLCTFATANATTISTSGSLGTTSTNFSGLDLNVNYFNSDLGTLSSVYITLTGNVEGIVRLENLGEASSTIDYNLSATVSLERPDGGIMLVTVLPTQTDSFAASTFDGEIDFAGLSGSSFTGLDGTDTKNATFTDLADLTLF